MPLGLTRTHTSTKVLSVVRYFRTGRNSIERHLGRIDPLAECGHLGEWGASSATDCSARGVCRFAKCGQHDFRRGHLLMTRDYVKGW